MGYPKYRVLMADHEVSSETVIEMPKAKMFGGGTLVGDGVNQVNTHVYTSDHSSGPWVVIFCLHTQYSGMSLLAPFPCKRWIKITPSGTGVKFSPYVCLE